MIDLDNRYNFLQIKDLNAVDEYFFVTDITKHMREAFGDVIKESVQVVFHGREDTPHISRIVREKMDEIDEEDYIPNLDFGDIIVNLCNGNQVLFERSRSGNIVETFDFNKMVSSKFGEFTRHYPDKNYGCFLYYTRDIAKHLSPLFGDLLQNAMQIIHQEYIWELNADVLKNGDRAVIYKTSKYSNVWNEKINTRYGDIVITFTNGKRLLLTTSHDDDCSSVIQSNLKWW